LWQIKNDTLAGDFGFVGAGFSVQLAEVSVQKKGVLKK
jgi:hypothetical protein